MIEKLRKSLGADGKSRGPVKRATAMLFFGAIVLVFVFFGMTPDQMGLSGGGIIAQVNDSTISVIDLRDAVQRMEQRFGGAGSGLREFIQNQALESLIDREILFQGSVSEGLRVTDEEILDVIVNIPAFQEEGRFQRSFYENYLKGSKQTAGKFESEIKKDVIGNRLRMALQASLVPIDAEVARERQLTSTQVNIEFIEFTENGLIDKEKAALKAVADPEILGQVEAYYKQNTVEFSEKEKVHGQHVLIKFAPGDAAAESGAKKKIEEISRRLEKEDFAKVAKETSQDQGSSVKGGDLGYFERGQMVKAFEDVAFSLPVGKISEPVKSEFGYHLIKVLDHKQAQVQPLDQVKDMIAQKLKARQIVTAKMNSLRAGLKDKKNDEIQKFVKDYDLKWSETGAFPLSAAEIPKIGENEDLLVAAFRLQKKDEVTDRIYLVNGKNILARLKSNEAAAKPTVDRAKTIDELNQEKSYEVLRYLRDEWKKVAKIYRNGTATTQQ